MSITINTYVNPYKRKSIQTQIDTNIIKDIYIDIYIYVYRHPYIHMHNTRLASSPDQMHRCSSVDVTITRPSLAVHPARRGSPN